eukprot:13803099-Heterocapsa_arctica.AAC.1
MQQHPPITLYNVILSTIPPHLQEGWRIIKRGFENYSVEEATAEATATWIQANGRALGYRVPTAQERDRAFGMGEYLTDMGLSTRDLYDATGNMFDKDAIVARAACPVSRWLSGYNFPPLHAVPPAALLGRGEVQHVQKVETDHEREDGKEHAVLDGDAR